MYKLSTQALKPDMVLYEDIYSPAGEIIFKANTVLTQENIQTLFEYNFDEILLSEPSEINMTRYKHLHQHPRFQRFNDIYAVTLDLFHKIMRTLDTGLELNIPKLLSLRDDIMSSVHNGEQLLDYLYNMMPNENEITYNHCFNCGLLCYVFGKWIGMNEEDLDNLTVCGFIFDIGKTKISDELLWKPDKLTPEEFIQMQHHIHLGYELVKSRKLPPHVVSVMIMHHERCDGSGYPARLKENRIDPFALIAAIADTYEAMTHPRAQRVALTPFQAIRVFEQQGLDKYGPHITPILTRIAKMYLDRRVCVTGNLDGRITEIHEDALSRPTVYTNNVFYDLRTKQGAEITRML
ncbi:MAG: HD domain-containing protein [Lachnospiraceae bacterium]|jgi:HD-GYP domain-containing protein (c-di-GMP phosphodiesterase class II)|nr:HD domain-containing protein [Lachnospiraceae bacterium]